MAEAEHSHKHPGELRPGERVTIMANVDTVLPQYDGSYVVVYAVRDQYVAVRYQPTERIKSAPRPGVPTV